MIADDEGKDSVSFDNKIFNNFQYKFVSNKLNNDLNVLNNSKCNIVSNDGYNDFTGLNTFQSSKCNCF
jgi:hypothetical protein